MAIGSENADRSNRKISAARMRLMRVSVTQGAVESRGSSLRQSLRNKAVSVCNEKIAKKGEAVGLSFYAFFANKNDDPDLLMEPAEWWIRKHALDHFEKATKIREMITSGL